MGVEIERKFLVKNDSWRDLAEGQELIMQGYLVEEGPLTVRARVRGERGYLTIKGATTGLSRSEFEYEIPPDDARAMLASFSTLPAIEKVRHQVRHDGHLWEVDVFAGANAGLVVAEIELQSEDESFALPDWVGQEVSSDPRYFNRSLFIKPFNRW